MYWSRTSALSASSFLVALFLGTPAPSATAQASPEPARVHKSVRGTLQRGAVTESFISPGERAEVKDACWCCAPTGNTCTPGNKSGIGQALLERCF
jgi:hypothetical protein